MDKAKKNNFPFQLLLAPKYEGKFEVRLQIDAFLNPAGQINLAPGATVITRIIYEVVRPSVSILYKGKDCLSMGAIVAGSSFVEHITVVNNCEVSIPLRITLSNVSMQIDTSHPFAFVKIYPNSLHLVSFCLLNWRYPKEPTTEIYSNLNLHF